MIFLKFLIFTPKMLLLKNGVNIFLIFSNLNFSNYKHCLTFSSHISGLQAFTELKIEKLSLNQLRLVYYI